MIIWLSILNRVLVSHCLLVEITLAQFCPICIMWSPIDSPSILKISWRFVQLCGYILTKFLLKLEFYFLATMVLHVISDVGIPWNIRDVPLVIFLYSFYRKTHKKAFRVRTVISLSIRMKGEISFKIWWSYNCIWFHECTTSRDSCLWRKGWHKMDSLGTLADARHIRVPS